MAPTRNMRQLLDNHQQEILGNFLDILRGGMKPNQFNKVNTEIGKLELSRLVSAIDSMNHSAPEAKVDLLRSLYYDSGLSEILKDAELMHYAQKLCSNIVKNFPNRASELVTRWINLENDYSRV